MLAGKWAQRFWPSIAVLLMAGVIICHAQAPAAKLHLLDLANRQVEPLQATDAKAVVFFFVSADCPISNRYAPEVRRLGERYARSGVTFWLVYPDPDTSIETIRQHLKDYEYSIGALRDPRHELVKMAGVRVTPEAAVFVFKGSGRRVAYRGRIDNRHVAFGKTRSAPTTRDVERVLEMIVAGKPVASTTTRAIGCGIPDLQ
ncbi:MAG: redoxin family protein [Pyrinomonadaceae bacterium]